MDKVIHVDGSVNGIDSIYCIYLTYKKKANKKTKTFDNTMNVAEIEYLAVIGALEMCEPKTIICSDSRQVVEELNLERRVTSNKAFQYFQKAKCLLEKKKCKIVWISRSENLAGKYLEQRLKKVRAYLDKVRKRRLTNKQRKKRKYLNYGRK